MKRAAKSENRRRTVSTPLVMANPMAEQVGPEFHDETGMRAALAPMDADLLPAAELDLLCTQHQVLAAAAFDGSRMFPTWQVVGGGVLPGLGEVLGAMAGQPAWSVALWISTPHDDLAGLSPRAVLERAGDLAELTELAGATARRWS